MAPTGGAIVCPIRPCNRSEEDELAPYTRTARPPVTPPDDADGPFVSRRPVWLGVDEGGWDHARIHLSLLADARIDAYHLAVYVGLVARADTRSGLSTASEAELAGWAGCSPRTVRNSLLDLERLAYVLIERRPGQRSRYFVLEPPAAGLQGTLFHNPGTWCRGPKDPGASCRGKAPTPAPPAGVVTSTPAPPAGVPAPYKEHQRTSQTKPADKNTEAALFDFSTGLGLARAALAPVIHSEEDS